MKVADADEAVALMNDSPYGLTASFWTTDLDRAAELGTPHRDGHRVCQPLRLSGPGRLSGQASRKPARVPPCRALPMTG